MPQDTDAYRVLEARMLAALEGKDPAGELLEAGLNEADVMLLERIATDVQLMGADGPLKWLPGLARELLEELEDETD